MKGVEQSDLTAKWMDQIPCDKGGIIIDGRRILDGSDMNRTRDGNKMIRQTPQKQYNIRQIGTCVDAVRRLQISRTSKSVKGTAKKAEHTGVA